jgi:hypothetical protein
MFKIRAFFEMIGISPPGVASRRANWGGSYCRTEQENAANPVMG